MTRNGNYFIPISKRTKIAKKKHANLLISIHANSSKNKKASGASIWILPEKNINTNTKKNLLKMKLKNFKKSKNPKKFYNIRNNLKLHSKILYLNSQFKNIYKTRYNLATTIIQELKNITVLNQKKPKYAQFGILKSSNFPSLLIEIGFISNPLEEKHLNNKYHQNLIVKFIFIALNKFFLKTNTFHKI